MSCCGGNCGCGSGCKCGSGCGGCSMYPDVEKTPTVMLIEGITPMKKFEDGGEKVMSYGSEGGHGCSCGPNCKCNPCTC